MENSGSCGPIRILYVEDSPEDTVMVRRFIEESSLRDVHLHCVIDPELDLDGEVEQPWDLVLLSYRLGIINGVEFLKYLREAGAQCPVIMLTGPGDTSMISQLMRLGVEDFLVKDTLSPERLWVSIEATLKRKRQEEERIQLEERNRQLERLACLGETIAMAGHSIKNILTAIRGSMAVINDILSESEDRHLPAHWGIINRSLNQLNSFVLEMLDFAKSEEIRLRTADLNALCRETIKDCAMLARENGVRLHDELYPHLPPFRLDPERIKDALLNLVKNSIEACAEVGGGRVTLSTDLLQPTGEVSITVADNGPGICETVKNKLFKPFTSTKGPRGTGLGLAIVERNVLAHEGKISLESNGHGGAEFRIKLPIRVPPKAPARLAVATL
jgi:signal transduction histidine kinase